MIDRMVFSAPPRQRALGVLIAAAAVAYLWLFVPRGWVPHDEGMIGESADLVLHGALPHVDYEEPYTGGLTYLYAAVFRTAGVDLLNVRRVLYAGAAATAWLVYLVARRRLGPPGAAAATWVAVACSFPIYFAGLPSWWLLLCAATELWAMTRFAETRLVRYVVLAAAAAGVSVAIKQTGVYLVVALALWTLYDGGLRPAVGRGRLDRPIRWIAGAAALLFAALMLAPRLFAPEGIYLFAPAAATAAVLFAPPNGHRNRTESARSPVVLAVIASAVSAAPLMALLLLYGSGRQLAEFFAGVVIVPQKRLAFASMPMPGGVALWMALPVVVLIVAACSTPMRVRRAGFAALWAAALALPLAATRSADAYRLIWEAGRAIGALVPIVLALMLISGRIDDPRQRSMVFAAAAVLAWASLNQYPFSAAIYFCYTVPLVVVAAITAVGVESSSCRRILMPLAVLFGTFGIAIADRGDLYTLGHNATPVRLTAPLDLPRAHLLVSDSDAHLYRRVIASVTQRVRGGSLIAGPDCPEVYFLAGLQNPSGALFEFFSEAQPDDPSRWLKGDVIIINHQPEFSPPPSAALVQTLRREFVYGEEIGRFEIRWH